MLKFVLLLVLATLCLSKADDFQGRTADLKFVREQSKYYELLMFVRQNDLIDADFYAIGKDFDIEANKDRYDSVAVEKFLEWYKNENLLSRDAIYSSLYEEHRKEVALLFRLMYTAKDESTFYKTACWARIYVNDGVFTNAYYTAMFYRRDMQRYNLMKPHEVYPNFFFDSKIIEQAKRIKMMGRFGGIGGDSFDTSTIYVNYTRKFFKNDEYKLDYFLEDYDLNNFYFYFRQIYPIWMNSYDYNLIPKEYRGSLYLYVHQQLLARYYLERFSNGLGEIEDIDWQKPFYPGYYSSLEYPNGAVMPTRQRYSRVPYHKYDALKEIEYLEYRLLDSIDSGYVFDNNGTFVNIRNHAGLNILGNIIEGNADSYNKEYYNMYEYLVRHILGYNNDYMDKNTVVPSSLHFYSTSMRDPGFYRIFHRIINFVYRFKQYQPAYTYNDLVFPGVKITSVNMENLKTFFRYCDVDIKNAVYVKSFKEGNSFKINMCHTCLDYKPFSYRFTVKSNSETDAMVKIFLGPADDDMSTDYAYLEKYYKYFVEMDQFNVTLKQGVNNIEHYSDASVFTSSEMTSSTLFYKKLQRAIGGSEPFIYHTKSFGFPKRLTLPKGRPEGMKFKMFFYLYPYDRSQTTKFDLPYFDQFIYNTKTFGFPLDRPKFTRSFFTPNMYFQDVFIYNIDSPVGYGKC